MQGMPLALVHSSSMASLCACLPVDMRGGGQLREQALLLCRFGMPPALATNAEHGGAAQEERIPERRRRRREG
eukprot:754290-Hanusia_phi.AAC.1